MAKYPFDKIEPKWQAYWDNHKTFKVIEDPSYPRDKRRYVLDMFPYPSAQGLHVGHPEGYTATDIYCRYLRMNGYNVLHPMGYDAFGLPAENYAIKTGTHPRITTVANMQHFTEQIKAFAASRHPVTHSSGQRQRITVADISREIQLKRQDMVLRHPLRQQPSAKNLSQQIGFSATTNPRDHFHLTIPHKGNQFLQITITRNLHHAHLH